MENARDGGRPAVRWRASCVLFLLASVTCFGQPRLVVLTLRPVTPLASLFIPADANTSYSGLMPLGSRMHNTDCYRCSTFATIRAQESRIVVYRRSWGWLLGVSLAFTIFQAALIGLLVYVHLKRITLAQTTQRLQDELLHIQRVAHVGI